MDTAEEARARYVKQQNDEDAAWPLISRGLKELANFRPSGDDSVYDYWPNAWAAELKEKYESRGIPTKER